METRNQFQLNEDHAIVKLADYKSRLKYLQKEVLPHEMEAWERKEYEGVAEEYKGEIARLKKCIKDMAYTVSLPLHTTEAEALDYLKGFVWCDCETEEISLGPHTKHIESFEGVDMYFDSYLGSYIFIDNPSV